MTLPAVSFPTVSFPTLPKDFASRAQRYWLLAALTASVLACSNSKDSTDDTPVSPTGPGVTPSDAPTGTSPTSTDPTSGPTPGPATVGPSGVSPTGVAPSNGPTGPGPASGGQPGPGPASGGQPGPGPASGGQNNTGGTTNGMGGTTNPAPAGGGAPQGAGGDPVGPVGPVVCDASTPPAITRLGLEQVAQSDDLNVMVYASQPPGSNDWYLVDALGYIRIFSNGALLPTPFLDVSSEVQGSGFGNGPPTGGSQNYDERGLLSIAFPPDYATSGKFYVSLIPTSGDATDHDLVLEYTRSASDPMIADPSTRKAIVELEEGGEGYVAGMTFSYAKYHNGSTVLFGPDGMLYVGMGDGGGDCNAARPGTPQDVGSPYGKILRLDPNAPAPYAAEGNPFTDGGDARVFHYGLRNPFRFSFDSATGDLYIGEVGQWTNDALYFAASGSIGTNFGWPSFEGTTQNPSQQCASTTSLRAGSSRTNPIFNLSHGSEGGVSNLIVAIVGGSVYRGSAIPALQGTYLFAEFYPNRPVRALYQCGDETSDVTVIDKRCDPNTPDVACFVPVGGAPELRQVGAIVEGNDGELYIPANGNTLLKIVPAP